MDIRPACKEDQPRWDAFVESFDGGPYLLWAWGEAIEVAYGHKAHYLLAEEKGRILGVLPLVLFSLPLGRKALVSLPFCDYGGPLASSEEATRALLSAARELKDKLGASVLKIRSREPLPESELPANTAKVRLLLDLPSGSEALFKALKSKVRSQVRRPVKEGCEPRLGGAELLNHFYQIYCENMHFLGSPPHAQTWFEALVLRMGERARVGVVYLKEKPLAAGIILLAGQTVTIPWASSLRAYKRISPNMLLYWSFLAFAADNDFLVFDFGRSSPGSGTYRFKTQWGARPQPLFWYDIPAPRAGRQSASRLRPLVEDLWRHLPAGLVNKIGPRLRKYISL
ncbi:FemAB family PEP-CTERM system-associated protein [Thermosulfuriphilus ammonigenes]|uniref:FemAB family PEP-CTERM system-associated protein n=1 Tax=Thermosulfuriphilus ammonigenes TaxID=1936021 RepID=A0A6G7PY17_9BACT|nr:FemAB family XrtA/PEP-CTERM system-associated protein [Thermosulfuriphilus ammonigenes]MBA2849519.1 FemAB-related protein (PEP-CTERM system-associated) [Thermosulfuriphilus ammonigenes]QIJ72584.1 FemAB family PEP-CTERM system-associated protein [Thermosulfuriphilus ammonigenes]